MPKLLHHVTIEVFSKAYDSIASAYHCIDTLAPVPMEDVLKQQWKWHEEKKHTKIYDLHKKGVSLWEAETAGEEGRMTILTYRFTKQRDTKAFIEKLRTLPKEVRTMFLKDIERHIDNEGVLRIKFEKQALAKGKLLLASEGEKVLVRMNLAAYPKKSDTCVAVAEEILG